MTMTTDPFVAYVQLVVPNKLRPFAAWACDRFGYIYCDDDVRAWLDDPTSCGIGLQDDSFETVRVVTGTAAIVQITDVDRLRAPNSFVTKDLWIEWNVYDLDPQDVAERWRQAYTVADLLNAKARGEL